MGYGQTTYGSGPYGNLETNAIMHHAIWVTHDSGESVANPESLTEVLPEQANGNVRRFAGTHDKTAVLDKIEAALPSQATTYTIAYHECDHDLPASERTGCPDWTVERSQAEVNTNANVGNND